MSNLVVGPPDPAFPTLPPVQPLIPSHIEIVPGGRSLVFDTTNLDNSNAQKKIETVDYIQTTIGANHFGFRWPRYTYTITYANNKAGQRSEHVSDTVRVDKHGDATAFGRVTEMNDFKGVGPVVGEELDIRLMPSVSASDAQDNGLRFGVDAIVAGSNEVSDPDREVGATAYLRTSGGNTFAYWTYGVWLRAIRGSGIRVESWIKGGIRMFEALGTWQVGLDTSQGHIAGGEALRMAAGQAISFEPTGQRKLVYKAWTGDGKGDRWQFMNGPLAVLEIDSDGNIYKRGNKVL